MSVRVPRREEPAMSALVPSEDIEKVVGTWRRNYHVGRAVSAERTVYILHSILCLARHERGIRDLRDCPFSVALDRGIREGDWSGREDMPVVLDIDREGNLVPTGEMSDVR